MVYETRRVQGMSGVQTLSLTGSGDWAEGGSMGGGGWVSWGGEGVQGCGQGRSPERPGGWSEQGDMVALFGETRTPKESS